MTNLTPVDSRNTARIDNRPQTHYQKAHNKTTGQVQPQIHFQSQQALMHEVQQKLNEKLGLTGQQQLQYQQEQDFGPQAVANRILGFVEGHIKAKQADGLDDEGQQELISQARSGIEQGFSEARDIIEGMNMLNGKIKQDIDDTYALIQKGLDRLENGEPAQQEESIEGSAPVNSAQSSLEAGFASESKNAFSLDVKTQDGDVIRISAYAAYSQSQSMSYQSNEQAQQLTVSQSAQLSAQFSFSIQGDLDDGEKEALKDLMGQLEKISDKFFNGDMEAALSQAKSLQYDNSEIAQFAFKARMEETSVAALKYKQTGSQEGQQANPFQQIGQLFDQFKSVYEAPTMENMFDDPKQVAQDLLQRMVEAKEAMAEMLEEHQDKNNEALKFLTEFMPQAYEQLNG